MMIRYVTNYYRLATKMPSHKMEEKQQSNQQSCKDCTGQEESNKTCNICLEEVDISKFVPVCPCKGTQKYVHEHCLVTWFQTSGKTSCPSCKYEIQSRGVLKPWREWKCRPVGAHETTCVLILSLLPLLVPISLFYLPSLLTTVTNPVENTTPWFMYFCMFYLVMYTAEHLWIIRSWFLAYFKRVTTKTVLIQFE